MWFLVPQWILKISQGRGQGSLRKKHKVSLNLGSNQAGELLAFSLCQNDSKQYTGPVKKYSQKLIGLETLKQSKVFCFHLPLSFIHVLPSTETWAWERILDAFLVYVFFLKFLLLEVWFTEQKFPHLKPVREKCRTLGCSLEALNQKAKL